MAKAVAAASREWEFSDSASTHYEAVVALFAQSALDEAIASGFGDMTPPSPDAFSIDAAEVDILAFRENDPADRIPKSRAALVQFATRRLGHAFGARIRALMEARPAYGGHPLRAVSLRFALGFLAANSWRLPDGVFLPASGNLQAIWRIDQTRVVAQFEPDDIVWFSVLEDGQLQLTGRVSADEFAAQPRIQELVRT